ncbi:M50 family metallopeptidase [Lacrimispora sp.]|uniref:M50 family metallopeptidase n=1 Tax=Lacrimispora sp. TaxID=2719234 RepID=UPI0039938155
MTPKKQKQESKSMLYLLILFIIPIGAAGGYYIGQYTERFMDGKKSMSDILFSVIGMFLMIYISLFLQIIVHEGGHWLFGLMTGYRFSSFRIGSFMWIKQEGSIQFRRFSLTGTGGQCLMAPPEMKDGRFPYVLYNMGGSIANFFVSLLFVWISYFTKGTGIVSSFFFIAAITGFVSSLINAVPLKLDMISNDGYNALSLGKDPESLRSFWIQLKFADLSLKGVPVKEMPREWFVIPSPEAMKNSMTAFLSTIACSRLMEEKRFHEAAETIRGLLLMDTAIIGLHRRLMTTDFIYCELVGGKKTEALMELSDRKQKKFMKVMKNYPSVQRTEYAWALLFDKDEQKARKIRQAFEKKIIRYPYPGEAATERELMEYAERRSRETATL